MLKNLLERVEGYTIPGPADECWGWSASKLPSGRPRLGLKGGGRNASITAARVIVAARDGLPLHDIDPSSGKRWVARHSCDNVGCTNPAHIVPGTHAENTADMWARGRGLRGNKNPRTKLTPPDVLGIRARLLAGESQDSIARSYGVSQTNIGFISRGKTWSWLK